MFTLSYWYPDTHLVLTPVYGPFYHSGGANESNNNKLAAAFSVKNLVNLPAWKDSRTFDEYDRREGEGRANTHQNRARRGARGQMEVNVIPLYIERLRGIAVRPIDLSELAHTIMETCTTEIRKLHLKVQIFMSSTQCVRLLERVCLDWRRLHTVWIVDMLSNQCGANRVPALIRAPIITR